MRAPLGLVAVGLHAITLPAGAGVAQPAIDTQRVSFRAGADSTVLKGQLNGDQTIDYRLRASDGQTLKVELTASNLQNYFNVIAAGSDTALFIGSSSGTRFRGLLPSDGDVTVRVYLMRAAARRRETSHYSLRVGIAGAALAPVPASRDALIPGTPYHASALVPCGSGSSGGAARCQAFVIRRANNSWHGGGNESRGTEASISVCCWQGGGFGSARDAHGSPAWRCLADQVGRELRKL